MTAAERVSDEPVDRASMSVAAKIWLHGRAMFGDLSDKARSFASFRSRTTAHSGLAADSELPLSLRYFGNGANLAFLLQVFFGGRCESRELGTAGVWRASGFARSNAETADVVAFDVPWPWGVSFGSNRKVIEIPAWVRQAVRLPANRDDFFSSLHRSVRGEQMRKIRKHGLTCRTTHDENEIRQFYTTMYVPHVRERFGAAATVVPESRVVKLAMRGTLLQVVREGRVIAASVLYSDQQTLQSLWSGFDHAEPRLLDGATSALFYYLLDYAYAHGYRTVDYCGSRPLLSDGVFETKRRWGGTVYDDWSLETLLLQVNRLGPGVQAVLARCPWIARQDGKLIGKGLVHDVPLGAERLKSHWLRLTCPGLDGLSIHALHGVQAEARAAAVEAGVPVTLFDLKDSRDPLEAYCNE